MRKITKQASEAFIAHKKFKQSNTQVDILLELPNMTLYGHLVAYADKHGDLWVNVVYNTTTTKERLNGLCELWNSTRPFYTHNDYEVGVWINIGGLL